MLLRELPVASTSVSIPLPRSLYERAKEAGIDVEDLLIVELVERLQLGSTDAALAHLELAKKYVVEAKEHIGRGDAVQASEKMYKVVEECIKALAKLHQAPELKEAGRRGRWATWLLGAAATWLSRELNDPKVEVAWGIAYDTHVWGFHEAKYDVEVVKARIKYAEELLEIVEEKLKARGKV
jgi:hypothetical protein